MYQLAMRIMQIAVVVGFVYFTQDINPAPGTKEGLLVGIFWGVFAAALATLIVVKTGDAIRWRFGRRRLDVRFARLDYWR